VAGKTYDGSSLYGYLPEAAGAFADANGFLRQGCWTRESVTLRQHDGKRVPRMLWIQPTSQILGWDDWGDGETLQATQRVPQALLRCALFAPHHWIDCVGVNRLHLHYSGRALRAAFGTLLGRCGSWRPFENLDADRLKAGLMDACETWPGKHRVDAFGAIRVSAPAAVLSEAELRTLLPRLEEPVLKVFAKLLDKEAHPVGGPPGNGMVFVAELHRRLLQAGLSKEVLQRRIRQLCFGSYLPGQNPLEVLVSFFVEATRFLASATSGRIDALDDDAIVESLCELAGIVEGHLHLDVGREKTLDALDGLILSVVHAQKRPDLGTPVNFSKCLKAASLVFDHEYDLARAAAAVGIRDVAKKYGQKDPPGLKRIRTYVKNGRAIRKTIPERFLPGRPA